MKFVNPIDEKSRKYLKNLVKNAQNYRLRCRAHAILLNDKKYSIDAIADIFEVHRDTVSRWLDSWENKGVDGLKDAPKPGRPRKNNNSENQKRRIEYKSLASLRKL